VFFSLIVNLVVSISALVSQLIYCVLSEPLAPVVTVL